jgi:hypothetical protein
MAASNVTVEALEQTVAGLTLDVNNFWVLFGACLVLFMQVGAHRRVLYITWRGVGAGTEGGGLPFYH